MNMNVDAMNPTFHRLAQPQFVGLQRIRHAQLDVQKTVIHAFHADANRPPRVLATYHGIARHGSAFQFYGDFVSCFSSGLWGHVGLLDFIGPAEGAPAGVTASWSANCKSCSRA